MKPAAFKLAPIVLGLALAAGCANAPSKPGSASSARRLVVMAPAGAEMLVALGAEETIVGIGDFVFLDSLAELPRVGAYDAPNAETILELRADAFVTVASQAAAPAHARLEELGVQVVALDTSTYEGVFESLERIGRLVGREELAASIAERMRSQLEQIASRTADLPRRRVLFVVGRDPLYVAGPGSHADEMIELAGGANVAHDTGAPYARMSIESVLERMPEVIVDASDNRPGALRGAQSGSWGQWEFLPAVQNGRVYWVDPSRLAIPGIELPAMTERLGRMVHPEVFADPLPADYVPPNDAGS